MSKSSITFLLMGTLLMTSSISNSAQNETARFSASEGDARVNGLPVVLLESQVVDSTKPQITGVQLLPGRGMNIFQVHGYLPGKGKIDVLVAPELKAGENSLGDAADDFNGNLSFSHGGALLVPFANRIRGQVSGDGKTLKTVIDGQSVTLPANWSGKNPGAEKIAMHGLILDSKIQGLSFTSDASSARATGTLSAGNFNGHWLSQARLTFEITLKDNLLHVQLTAKNVGKQDLPIGMGWHPYFNFPSGNRSQVSLSIPAKNRLLVNNYDDVFPTGKMEAVAGTPYDFNHEEGKALGDLYMDDCFTDLLKVNGVAQADIRDPLAGYHLRVSGLSPEISAFQAYAPIDKSFVALEPQFNLADPYNLQVWPQVRKNPESTGMVVLKPGQSTQYDVELQLLSM